MNQYTNIKNMTMDELADLMVEVVENIDELPWNVTIQKDFCDDCVVIEDGREYAKCEIQGYCEHGFLEEKNAIKYWLSK